MKTLLGLLGVALAAVPLAACAADKPEADAEGWYTLLDGTSMEGWKASENKESWRLEEGQLVAHGPRSHLFYVGPVNGADFKNFELKVEVLTRPGANSGVYFHTRYQQEGWPDKGYEVQVNNTHRDPKKSGGLYAVQDVFEAPAKDNEWFEQHIVVRGKRVTVKVDGKQVVDYTEPENPERAANMQGRLLSSGTFALQAHDPASEVRFRSIKVKPLP